MFLFNCREVPVGARTHYGAIVADYGEMRSS
jgi:hypothetical protein